MVESVSQCLALLKRSCSHVADKHSSNYSILVTDVNAGKITVALLEAELEVLVTELVIELDPLADELESGKCLLKLYSVVVADALNKLG